MPTWGNNDSANSKPLLPVEREVRGLPTIATLVTANATTGGSNVVFTTATSASLIGSYVYTVDANNAVSRFVDRSIIDQNDVAFLKSNNTVVAVTPSNNSIRLANNVIATLAAGQTVYFANAIAYHTGTQASKYSQDTILVTATRASNSASGNANVAIGVTANQVGSISVGWVHVQKKTNNDGTVRYLKETLVSLANPTAANTSSGNTSFGNFLAGL